MNAHYGSLQRKGNRYYLVQTVGGRQKWLSLKTDNLRVARLRANQIAPVGREDEERWLSHLVELGEKARARLGRIKASSAVPWRSLWPAFCAHSPQSGLCPSAVNYRRWLEILADLASSSMPVLLTPDEARQISESLARRYVSAGRMIVFFRRVWRTLDWDASVWKDAAQFGAHGIASEFYRRLELDEIRQVIVYLTTESRHRRAHFYADMVVIGYYTGLRLSDVAELERGEVSPQGDFLLICPNKTRQVKGRLIRVPLVPPARQCVKRLLFASGTEGFLFPEDARKCPTKVLCRAFRACGIEKRGRGRASFHSLRATFISLMDEAGIPPHVTDAITGHAGGGMHARYTQPSNAALMRAVERALPPLGL